MIIYDAIWLIVVVILACCRVPTTSVHGVVANSTTRIQRNVGTRILLRIGKGGASHFRRSSLNHPILCVDLN